MQRRADLIHFLESARGDYAGDFDVATNEIKCELFGAGQTTV